MILIKIVIVLFGAYIFFVFTSILLNWIRSKYIKLNSKENENLHMVNQAGEEVLKFDVDSCFVIEDWKFIGDLPVKDRIKFHDFIECLEEYKVPYIYVADKEGKNLIHIAVGRDFNRAKIELEKIH